MNAIDSCLRRLFRAAAGIDESLPTEAPFWLEAQVMTAWRGHRAAEPALIILPVMRKAFFCACAVVVITAALTFQTFREPPPSELVVVDSAIQSHLLQ